MEPPDRGRGRYRGRGSGTKQYGRGRGRASLALTDFPTVQQAKQQGYKETLVTPYTYQKKDVSEPLLTLSVGDLNLHPKDAWSLKERYLQNQQYLVPEGRARFVCEAMLTETQSVQITHNHVEVKNSKSPITHSKCFITKIIHPQEWGLSTFACRTLRLTGQQYNYWDYVQAWNNAFLYQNPVQNHSWFFLFNPEIVKKENAFPSWFLHWWEIHSPLLDIFPEEIQKLFAVWFKYHPQLGGSSVPASNIPIGLDLLWFCAEFRINWIWQWGYEILEDHLLIPNICRNFAVKWWSRFDTESCLVFINETIEEYKAAFNSRATSSPKPAGPVNFVQELKEMIHKQHSNLSENDLEIKLMEAIKQQFLATQSSQGSSSKSHADDSKSDTSMTSLDPGRYSCLAGEAQDPYDEDTEAIDPTEEDLWDSIIALKSQRGKGKQHRS